MVVQSLRTSVLNTKEGMINLLKPISQTGMYVIEFESVHGIPLYLINVMIHLWI